MRNLSTIIKSIFTFIICFLITCRAYADYALNMTPGVTPVSRDIYELHMIIFWICVAIGVLVFGVMFYALIKHRKSVGHKPADFHEHPMLEIVWAIIPFIILIAMAVPATTVLMRMEDSSLADLNIKVTGFQWKWKYDYLDEGFGFFSNLSTPIEQIENKVQKDQWYLLEVDKPLVVPIHKKIRFLVTSNDVIHSWWVPAFGIKRDAIPGFIHESWARIDKPGIYRGQCAELCGINHGYMPIVVEAKTEAEFEKWAAEQRAALSTKSSAPLAPTKQMTKDELMAEGNKDYGTFCASCHKPDGTGMPPVFKALKNSPVANGPANKHIQIVLAGVSGTAMQGYKDQLTDEQIAAIVTYERNSWGNGDTTKFGKDAGGIVEPADVFNIRTGVKTKTITATSKLSAQTQKIPQIIKPLSKEEQMKKGEDEYNGKCSVCHKPDGTGMPPVFKALKGSAIANGLVSKHIDTVLNGVSGTPMQPFKDQLSDEELSAIITYERNAWGNGDTQKFGKDAGGIVQPADIAKQRNK